MPTKKKRRWRSVIAHAETSARWMPGVDPQNLNWNVAPASRGRPTVAKSKPQMPWKKPELIMYSFVRFVPNNENVQFAAAGSYVNRRFTMPQSPLSSCPGGIDG